ncbi:MAG: PAS domain S-box protein, partial [Anaerolineae bacterium]|nr:PAS domain S-box protein [Anaerolineae bacterium]
FAGVLAVEPGLEEEIRTFSQMLAITSGVSYYLALAPPRWLRQALQNTELYYFLAANAQYPLETRAAESLGILRQAATRAVGGRAALVVEKENQSNSLSVRSTGQFQMLTLAEGTMEAIHQAWQTRKPLVLYDLNAAELQLARQFDSDTIFVIPIATADKVWGLLLVFAYGKPLFAEDEMALLSLFSEQTALILDYTDMMGQLRDYAQHLKQTHADEMGRFFRLSNNLLSITDFEGSFRLLNPAWERTLGYSIEEIIAKDRGALVHPDDQPAARVNAEKVLRGEEVRNFEVRYLHKDGSVRWLLWNAIPMMETRTIYAVAHDITQQKHDQEALRESEEQLRLVIDNIPALISYMDTEERYRFSNQVYEEWFGVSPQKIIGKTARELIGGQAYAEIRPYIDAALSGQKVSYELPLRDKDGNLRYTSISYVPDITPSGKVNGYFVLATDITERQQAEESIYRHTQRLRILNNISHLLTEATTDYQRMLDTIARETAEQIKDSCLIRLLSSDGQRLEPVAHHDINAEAFHEVHDLIDQYPISTDDPFIGAIFRSGEAELITQATVHELFARLRVEYSSVYQHIGLKSMLVVPLEAHGQRLGLLKFTRHNPELPDYTSDDLLLARNLADRIAMAIRNAQLLRDVQASERHLRQVLDSLFAYVSVLSPEGILLEANRPALQDAGLSLDSVMGQPYEETYWWSYDSEVQAHLRAAIQNAARGERSRYDARIRLADDHFITIDFMLAPMLDEEGKVTHLIPSGIDITERQRAEEELQNTASKLQATNLELQNFAYIASHDLQEPLRKVQTFGDRLKTKYADVLDETGQDYLDRIQNAARRMQGLIQALLTYSRITAQTKPFEPVPLNQVLDGVLSDLEVRIQETHAKIHIGHLETLDADPMQMNQLFQNLVGNSLKYHRPGVAPEIEISGQQVAHNLYEICVKDNGIGFDEKYLDKIFGLFQRLHGRVEYEGTGMGLAICKRIVEQHEGQITAKSVENEGTTFIVRLPIRQRIGKDFVRRQTQ